MSENAIYAIAAGIVMTISTITPAIAQGITSKTAMEAIARQPDLWPVDRFHADFQHSVKRNVHHDDSDISGNLDDHRFRCPVADFEPLSLQTAAESHG